jgi:uncharacterized protein (TIGR02246 family)
MGERTPAELAHAWRDALVRRDADAFAELFAEAGVFVDVEHRTADLSSVRPIEGRPAIAELTRSWLAETPAFEYEVTEVLEDGESAAVRWRYGVPGVTRELDLEGVSWLRCARGEILEAHVYFDSLGLYRGLGRV